MRHIHLILEVHCLHGISDTNKLNILPQFCKFGSQNPGYHCMENNCKFVAYTDAPFEIAYSSENGQVLDKHSSVGFGGDMEPEDEKEENISMLKKLWGEICKNKIDEAYEEYMMKTGFKKYSEG